MKGKGDDPGLDSHLLPIEEEPDCALCSPCTILNSRSSSGQGQLPSVSLALPCPCHSPGVTAPTGQFPKASNELRCHFCICLFGQTLAEKHGALAPGIIPHCLFMVHQ